MSSNNTWLANQLKGYVLTNLPSWNNLGNNTYVPPQMLVEKPPFEIRFIEVSENYAVEAEDAQAPFTVKTLYVEDY